MESKFCLTNQECELLVEFGRHHQLQDLALALGKDISVVSRQLKALAEKQPVLAKSDGRWVLTAQGEAMIKWSKEAMLSQRMALNGQQSLRIATTREFCTRILLPNLAELLDRSQVVVSFITSDSGIERSLLKGDADMGFDCGRPRDPMLAFKRVVPESFSVVIAPSLAQERKITGMDDLHRATYLKFLRSEMSPLLKDSGESQLSGMFSDISCLREACILGMGWAVLPTYTVKKELSEKRLVEMRNHQIPDEQYGVWWNREIKSVQLDLWVPRFEQWLRDRSGLLV